MNDGVGLGGRYLLSSSIQTGPKFVKDRSDLAQYCESVDDFTLFVPPMCFPCVFSGIAGFYKHMLMEAF